MMLAPEFTPQLYNLTSDIGESQDLATAKPEVLQELHTAWQAWNQTMPPPARTTPPQKK